MDEKKLTIEIDGWRMWPLILLAFMIYGRCERDTDHAIVNAYAKEDTTNAAFVYYRGDQMVTIQGDTLMIRGEWVVVRNGEVVP